MKLSLQFRSDAMASLARVRSALCLLLLISLPIFILAGCRNRGAAPNNVAQTGRKIERLTRSQYDVPADYGVAFGHARASDVPGYDELRVIFSHGDKHVDFAFLLSHDRKWLARLQRFDLGKDLSAGID